jgi:hypothetical protein
LFNAGLVDEQQKVRTITALAIAALAEAATPYGIESFDSVLKPLWKGIRTHRGKVRFLKCENLYIFITKMMFRTSGYWCLLLHPGHGEKTHVYCCIPLKHVSANSKFMLY